MLTTCFAFCFVHFYVRNYRWICNRVGFLLKIFSKNFDKNTFLDVNKKHMSRIRGDFFFRIPLHGKCKNASAACSHAVMQSEYEKKTSPSECHVRMTCLSVFLSFLFLLLNSLNSFDL